MKSVNPCLFYLCTAAAFFSINLSTASAKWKKIVEFKFKNKNYHINVSNKMKGTVIKGVGTGLFGAFEDALAHNNIALISRYDGKGPSKELLAAAAKAANRPSIKHAGALVEGCSKNGRRAAQWAGFNPTRTLAVLLNHSDAAYHPHTKPENNHGNLPLVPGVPMLFNATHNDLFQGTDRRDKHYNWCKNAYTRYKQPCTSSINIKKSGHCRKGGSSAFQNIWLKEALVHRLPNDPNGKFNYDKPYKLRQVSIANGGAVFTKLGKDGKRSFHTDVIVGKYSPSQFKKYNFWLPGPQSAAMYIAWTKKNGGRIKKDGSKSIRPVIKAQKSALAKK